MTWRVYGDEYDDDPSGTCLNCGQVTFDLVDIGDLGAPARDRPEAQSAEQQDDDHDNRNRNKNRGTLPEHRAVPTVNLVAALRARPRKIGVPSDRLSLIHECNRGVRHADGQ
jgi:hypothetical protein